MPAADTSLVCATVLLSALAIRACVGLFGYSGEHTPPMYGDFEAQRHWMELTVNLPPSAWYVQGPHNDLQYWGLDYPPLSAHMSWLLGRLAHAFGHPELVALHKSRGHESEPTRAFMRNTVLACDGLVFFTAAVAFSGAATFAANIVSAPTRSAATRGATSSATTSSALLPDRLGAPPRATLLVQLVLVPALVLVDHGHFQYNCVSLGLALWAFHHALCSRPLLCSACFSLALNFKQMSLYLAPAFFCYLLAGCHRRGGTRAAQLGHVLKLGAVVVGTFALCWLPFLLSGDLAHAKAVHVRIFPVERHLYEDKVANFWCTLSLVPFLKLKRMLSIGSLLKLALLATFGALVPPCALLLRSPSRLGFLLCATSCGLAFFLCSYQVHEKHILLPLLPLSLLAHRIPALFGWFATVACFSLFPLLKRDGLVLPYWLMQAAFLALSLALSPPPPPPPPPATSDKLKQAGGSEWAGAAKGASRPLPLPPYAATLMAASVVGMLLLHALEALVTPPARYPDLHSVAFAAFSCVHFGLAYVAAVATQWAAAKSSAGDDEHTPLDAEDAQPAISFLFPGDRPAGAAAPTSRAHAKQA